MILIKERDGKFLNFFTSSILVGLGGLLLEFLIIVVSFIIIFTNFYLPFDYVILNFLILFISQIIGSFIIYFILIPFFKVKSSEYRRFSLTNSLKTIILICGTFTFVGSLNFILNFIFRIFNISPLSGYSNILLNFGHLSNPMNILIYYLPLTVGASVYEELLFRRTLIPSLEQRGMSTSFAILSSSLLFALAHLPNDLLSANIPGIIMHISAVFLIGISTGLIYTLTRNIVYSIIIHGVLNFISFSGPLVALISNSPLTLTYNILYWTIYALGIGVIIFSLVQFFKKREVEWVILLKEKNHYPIFYGFIGFLVIGTISLFIPLVMQSIVVKLEIAVYNVLWYFIILIICYSSALIIFFVLRVITVYISKNESSKVKNSIKKLQMEVKKIE